MRMTNNQSRNQKHEVVELLSPDGINIDIDVNLAGLILQLWDMGIDTLHSCEGTPTNFSWEDEYVGGPSWNKARHNRAYISMKNTPISRRLMVEIIGMYEQLGETDNSMWGFEFNFHNIPNFNKISHLKTFESRKFGLNKK